MAHTPDLTIARYKGQEGSALCQTTLRCWQWAVSYRKTLSIGLVAAAYKCLKSFEEMALIRACY